MKYIKADSVLPIALVEELQSYIQGGLADIYYLSVHSIRKIIYEK